MEIRIRKKEETAAKLRGINNALYSGFVGTHHFYFGFNESEDIFGLRFEASSEVAQANFLRYIDNEFQIFDIKFDESAESQFLNTYWKTNLESANKQVEAIIKPEVTIEPPKKNGGCFGGEISACSVENPANCQGFPANYGVERLGLKTSEV